MHPLLINLNTISNSKGHNYSGLNITSLIYICLYRYKMERGEISREYENRADVSYWMDGWEIFNYTYLGIRFQHFHRRWFGIPLEFILKITYIIRVIPNYGARGKGIYHPRYIYTWNRAPYLVPFPCWIASINFAGTPLSGLGGGGAGGGGNPILTTYNR